MDGFDGFLDTYGVAAASLVMLIKAAGVPLPIPGDVILLATAARAAEGKVFLGVAFVALLVAIVGGSVVQFYLARGPARQFVAHHGHRVGITPERLERVAAHVKRGGPIAIGLAVLTPGVRSAVIPACGLTGVPLRVFLPGLALGSTADLALHFAIGFAGSSLLATVVQPAPLLVVAVLAVVGLGAWLVIARRRKASRAVALNAWAQATCPACLLLGSIAPLESETAIRWSRAA